MLTVHRQARRMWSEHRYRINLHYERHLLELRSKRRGILFGVIQHMCYMVLLAAVILMQTDGGPQSAYMLESTLSQYARPTCTAHAGPPFAPRETLPPFTSRRA